MEFPPPPPPQTTWLVRQTNEDPPPELDPVASAANAAEQWGYYEADVKRREDEQKAKNAARDKDKTQCWLRRATTELDAASAAILRKGYADMFECEEPQWKINMEKHIAKARELSAKDDDKDE
jgi:hypothetical protein